MLKLAPSSYQWWILALLIGCAAVMARALTPHVPEAKPAPIPEYEVRYEPLPGHERAGPVLYRDGDRILARGATLAQVHEVLGPPATVDESAFAVQYTWPAGPDRLFAQLEQSGTGFRVEFLVVLFDTGEPMHPRD